MFSKKCKAHLEQAEMGRMEHFWFALGISAELFIASLALAVHALMPRFFETTASDKIYELVERFEEMKK